MENQRMKDIKYIIADNARLYRKKGNLAQAELAEWAELSLDTIKQIEGGKRTMSLENFLRFSDAFCVPLSFFLYDQTDMMPETERIHCILEGKSESQKEYLLHMLEEIAAGMGKLL